MSRPIRLQSITLRSGDVVRVAAGVTAIVGPNNTGKSSLLRGLVNHLQIQHSSQWQARDRHVVEGYQLEFDAGGIDNLWPELDAIYGRRQPGRYDEGQFANPHYRLRNGAVEIPTIEQAWGTQTGLGPLAGYFATYLDADSRLGLAASTGSFDAYRQVPTNALQMLYANRTLEAQLDLLTTDAFKIGTVVHRYAANTIHLLAGAVQAAESLGSQTDAYQAELNALPQVQSQGDGMRAFVGMVMAVITGRSPLILIDEPEAFLHPPQARLFGKFLADYASSASESQVIIATHSKDIITGLTSGANANGKVSVVRLTRDQSGNHAAQLEPSAVQELYGDPLIKYYDMLDGLFTTGVVLCEADSDCTYYRAVIDEAPSTNLATISEAHFTHAGGKARISRAINAFRATKVPVAAIFDIDILQDDNDFKKLVSAAGADESVLAPLRTTVVLFVRSRASALKRSTVKSEIETILAEKVTTDLSKTDAQRIRDAAAQKTGWSDFKKAGKALLSGGDLIAFTTLQQKFEEVGIFILEQGELERLHAEGSQNDKAKWLRDVIAGGKYKTSPALPMLERISAYLESKQSTTQTPAGTP